MYRNVIFVIWGLSLLIASVGFAGDRPRREQPWEPLEILLQQEGVATDAISLIHWVREAPPTASRWAAVEVLGLRGDSEAIPLLRSILAGQEDRLLRESSALALARLGDPEGVPALREFVHSSQEWSRQIYLAARLAELGDPAGYSYVAEAARSKTPDIRYASAAALVAFLPFQEETGALERFLALARDEDAKVRNEFLVQAPIAVTKGADLATIKRMVKELAVGDTDPEVKQTADLLLSAWAFEESNRSKKPEGL